MNDRIPRLHLISDRWLCPLDRFPELARLSVDAGVDAVHLREKDLPGRALADAGRALRRAIGDRALLFVNERVDVALVIGADGVQLPETGLSPREVREIAGPRLLIGRSVHDVEGAERAAAEGADFVIAGNVYETGSKPGQAGRGLEFVRSLAERCPIPVVAIGGITPERVSEVLRAGAWGIAVISGILGDAKPAEAARRYREALDEVIGGGD
ncbi:thiamine phosphate synthase [Thermomicrobiaceae bacterium CFH 74404]|uniref:Thiamine-phosphate synthase n=1 Tax=Thermalbibacter longus TaxID=2951981 RepID=A0AA41WGC1_9BACT|nr:thiamine phosphate synthase [Thermalbibacter longus]MCM8749540.1 thiamine phosphate synthase [Thermalbibacter longus]